MTDTKQFKIIIAGSRDFSDYGLLLKKMDFLLSKVKEPICIIGGETRGADALGKQYAFEKGYEYFGFPAHWNDLGKSAGYVRNQEMANAADALVAFWDGISGSSNLWGHPTK